MLGTGLLLPHRKNTAWRLEGFQRSAEHQNPTGPNLSHVNITFTSRHFSRRYHPEPLAQVTATSHARCLHSGIFTEVIGVKR